MVLTLEDVDVHLVNRTVALINNCGALLFRDKRPTGGGLVCSPNEFTQGVWA
jgi:hypothetical protein